MAFPKAPIFLFLLLVAGLGFSSQQVNNSYSTNYGAELVMDSGGGTNGINSTNFYMDTVTGLVAGPTNSINFGTYYGLFLFNISNHSNITVVANITIIYPVSLTGYPTQHLFQPGACYQLVTVNETDNWFGSRTIYCTLYFNNGSGVWQVNANLSNPNGGITTFNYSNINQSGQYAVNCTVLVNSLMFNSSTEYIDITGTSFCSAANGNPDATWIFGFLLILLGMMYYFGGLPEYAILLMTLLVLFGVVAYGGVIAQIVNLPNMNDIFSLFAIVYAIGLVVLFLYFLVKVLISAYEILNKRGN